MTAPVGTNVGLYVDLVARVAVGDVIETQTGRRYGVASVRVQERGKHAGRQHLRVVVLGTEPVRCVGTIHTAPSNVQCLACRGFGQRCELKLHRIRWYSRGRGRR